MAMILLDAAGSSSVSPPPTHDDEHDEGLALAIIAGQQPMAVNECDDPESEVDFVPLRVVRPDDEQQKRPGGRVKVCAHKPKTKKRNRGRPARVRSAKSNMWCKPEFVCNDNINITSSETESEGNKDDDYVPTGKRGRQARAKSAKTKTWRKPGFVYSDNYNISSSESEGNKDDDYDPMAPDADGHPKKCARSRGRPARAKSAKSKMWRNPEFVCGDNINISSSSESEIERNNNDDDYDPTTPDADGHRNKYESFQDMRGSAFERASEVNKKLPRTEVSLVRRMLPSHVDRVFWMGLPRSFCRQHLPKQDTVMTLEDEEGRSYPANYLVARDGLSGGWKHFAEDHRLKVDDALVFRLVGSEKFKVYIVREGELTTTDYDVRSKEEDAEVTTSTTTCDDINNLAAGEKDNVDVMISPDDSEPDGGVDSMVSFSSFNIVVNSVLDTNRELFPDHLRATYYKLCLAQKACLHRNLLEEVNPKMAIGAMVETASIAEGVRASSPASREDLA
ncbi:B3 domain-containing protein Os01g0234100-like isoform X2 [Triticum aestivum]|uniref:B3 domain-containing protein Os01g0234100-like isoform X2 n=1 Tax=Triticum aestivum TaxID=4565 RepID=UPI001D025BDE|nr:B3 domain-containing protein Os01g0234100-like isoform X2 [Triticum aestivum]